LIELAGSTVHGSLQEDLVMDTVELRAAAARLVKLHGRFAALFGRRECQEHSLGYLRGLLLGEGRKSVEPMALVFGGPSEDEPQIAQHVALAWQRFVTVSPWEAQAVQQGIQAVFNEEFVPTARQWPIGTVGVIDGSGFVKRGTASVGVERQWCGRLGKKENCQVGVFLLGVTPAGSALLDHGVPAGGVGGRRPATQQDAGAAGDHLPNEARDRREAGGEEFRAFRLAYRR
jgi:SRSO17 transposase